MTQGTTKPVSAGALPPERIHRLPPRIDRAIIERFLALDDLSGTVSDVLDQLGLRGVVGASRLRPTLPAARIVGIAVTVRNVPQERDPYPNVSENDWRMAEIEGIHQGEPGDVLVIEGLPDISNMGGIMATLAKRQGLAGAVVDGGVRDVGTSRRLDFPVWSKDVTPTTGKWRCVTQEINGVVKIEGLQVHAGDLVVADETGVCFVPREKVGEVLTRAEAVSRYEEDILQLIADGTPMVDFVARLYSKRKPQSNT
jgi:regulator of RNase E activity RraA